MSIDVLAVGDSTLHRIDPRVRVAAATAFSVVVAVSYHLPALWAALICSIALAALARLPAVAVARRLVVVNGLVIVLWAVIPFTFPGEPLWRVGPLAASHDGVRMAAQITLKSNAIVLCFMALVATMAPATLGHALHRVHVPDKIVHLLLMTYRYIFVAGAGVPTAVAGGAHTGLPGGHQLAHLPDLRLPSGHAVRAGGRTGGACPLGHALPRFSTQVLQPSGVPRAGP